MERGGEVAVLPLASGESSNPKYFFWSGKSKLAAAVSLWRKRLAQVFEDAEIENGHSHCFRDTFACSLLQAGVSIQDVSVLLGHRSVRITILRGLKRARTRLAEF
jgi:integrase/recombinase XerD